MYGPITSWTQLVANKLGGENMHDIVFWLQVFSVVPFILACAGVFMLAHGDTRRQGRAALLTIANPLLIWAVVAGAHNEPLAVMFAVAGLLFMRKNPFIAGLGIGLAGCAKVSIGLWGLAMLWAYRREPKKALLLCLGTAVPMGLAYVLWQPTAFLQALRNGGYVSVGSWANPLYRFLDVFMTGYHAKVVVGVISYIGLIVIGWMLSRVVPWTPLPAGQGCRPAAGSAHHRSAHRTGAVGRVADHLDVHTLLVRPACLDAASRAGGQQARQDHADQGHSAVTGVRTGTRDRYGAGPRLHRHADAGHRVADRSDGDGPCRDLVVATTRSSGALPLQEAESLASRSLADRLRRDARKGRAPRSSPPKAARSQVPVPVKELASRRRS